ncbi:MAG: transporter substrate-binding domain-containing protein [Betaproteobacteria bacterium]|nr:transporter substrate-binding domain-containing protein [Betaproteobacteria bacterium]
MHPAGWSLMLATAALAACASLPEDQARRELLPTGKLRVGIGIGASPSAFWATRDPATGQPRGVTVDLANALAKKLDATLELVIYPNSGEVTAAGPKGEWDAAFMPEDAERRKLVDFGPAYYLSTSTYMVRAGSPISTLAEVDQPGVRVAGIANTTTARTAIATLKNTRVISFRTVDEMVARMKAGELDAIALGRDSLRGLQPQIPGSRILDGHFHATGTAVAVPKNHPAALAYVSQFIEEAKSSGIVRRAFDGAGMRSAPVAPSSTK